MKPTQKQQYSRSSSSIYLIDYWSCLCPELRPSRPEGWAGGVEGLAGSCWVLSSGKGSTGTRPLRWLSRWTLGSRFGLDSYLEEEMGEEWREWRLNGEGSRERTKGKRWKRKQFNQTKMNSTESLSKCVTQQESFGSENMVIKTGETQWLHSTVLASLFEWLYITVVTI